MAVEQFPVDASSVPSAYRVEATQGFVTLVGLCTCGNPAPILLVLHPGAPNHTKCNKCGTKYRLQTFGYSENNPEAGADVEIISAPPTIVRPS